jgi:DNA-binding NtrC family response regulator
VVKAGPPITSTVIVDGDRERLVVDAAELKVTHGPDRGTAVRLGTDSLVIGSDPACQLVLHDTTVSARHAEITMNARGFVIRDLGSTNGIAVGRQLIERAPIIDGSRLWLGHSAIVVRALGEQVSIALGRPGSFGLLIAHSLKMRAVTATIEQLAPGDATVLIEGETGTGKEVAAQALHGASGRRGPFVVVDCGAMTPSLLAGELFGHERGAFTGADHARPGLFEEADGGTLFLDEVGEMPLDLQPLLLGLVERKAARRVGGTRMVHSDVRVVVATNRNLADEVRAGRFRQDLFYRLSTARIRLPPLRERIEDIPHLAAGFAREHRVTLSPDILALLAGHAWPGNVRELRNTIARLAVQPDQLVLGRDAPLPDAFTDERGGLRPMSDARRRALDEFERRYIAEALARGDGSPVRAAELAGVTRQYVTRLAVAHGVRSPRDE